jgi:hypothetical protein
LEKVLFAMRTSSGPWPGPLLAILLSSVASPGLGEESTRQIGAWAGAVSGGATQQFDANFSDAPGDFSVSRGFLQGSFAYAWDRRTSVSLSVGGGIADYDFSPQASIGGEQPWEQIEDYRISLPMRFSPTEKTDVIVIPSVRTSAESGASLSDGRTEGVLAGVSWRLSDTLTIGPGFGWFSELGGGNTAFPIVVVDWKITEQLSLTTGRGMAASQGPGLTLNYQLAKNWKLGLTGRFERTRFSLDSDPGQQDRVGEDRSVPLLLVAEYSPWPMTSISIIAGAEFDGRLKLEDAAGDTIAVSEFDTAPVIGLAFSSRF